MSEKLIIRNFGPITNVELDLRKVNVLIGDQGTGKSTVAKIYTIINNFIYLDILNDEQVDNSNDPVTARFFKHLDLFDLLRYLKDDTSIVLSNEKFNFNYFNKKVQSVDPEKFKLNQEDLNKGTFEFFLFNYITAERVFISTLADALYGLINLGTKLPQLFSRFGNKFQSVRKEKEVWDYMNILNANYSHTNGVDYVIMSNGEKIFLSDASTGLQGTMPMLVVFDGIVNNINKKSRSQVNKTNLLVVEEPELNLFPETQKKVVDYIIGNNFDILDSTVVKEYKNQLIITTHSPYILTSLNNLMYAFEVGKMHADEVEKVVERKNWLNPNDVSAYELKIDGTCEDIFDREESLIKAEKIDEISTVLNKDFNDLINIEIGLVNEKH